MTTTEGGTSQGERAMAAEGEPGKSNSAQSIMSRHKNDGKRADNAVQRAHEAKEKRLTRDQKSTANQFQKSDEKTQTSGSKGILHLKRRARA
ncbi:similar to An01g02930 [Aspergillus luchuensis]|uniref:Similar to An01g02930 n=1 Tax=Aspergillus kawachii TaxID=1069201 RepID=A0A146FYL6_ASPKA|nr:similar to An01g02930 [Aspergillus luchuensis]